MDKKASHKTGATFSVAQINRLQDRHYSALGLIIVAIVLLSLSLTHLADGLHKLTGDTKILSLLLAIGIDLGVIASEAALIISTLRKISGVKAWAVAVLVTTLIMSATINSLSFTSDKQIFSFAWFMCVFLGCFIPLMVFGIGKITAGLLVGSEKLQKAPNSEIIELKQFLDERAKHKTNSACAKALGINASTVTRRLSRAKKLGLAS